MIIIMMITLAPHGAFATRELRLRVGQAERASGLCLSRPRLKLRMLMPKIGKGARTGTARAR